MMIDEMILSRRGSWAHNIRGNITCIIPLLSTTTTLEDEDGNRTFNTTDNRQQQQQSHNGTTKSSSPLGSSVHVSLAVAKMRQVGGFDNHINSSQVLHVDTQYPYSSSNRLCWWNETPTFKHSYQHLKMKRYGYGIHKPIELGVDAVRPLFDRATF